MRLRLAAFALIALVPSFAQAAAPVCALLDPDKDPRAALLEAKLLADPAATWVERANVDAVLKEQKLQTLFSPQGVGDRVKLGKLLKADLLVLVRPVKDAKEPALEIVVSETAGGLRLLLRGVPITKDADADVAVLLVAVRDGIKKHGEKIREVVAVPPFVSNDLEFTFDHMKGAYAKLAEAEALDRKGVVVVELAEAEALAKEIALADPGSKLDRPLPVYLLGEYRHEGKAKDRTLTVKMRAERGGKEVSPPASIAVKPEDAPTAVRKWAAATLDGLLVDGKPRPPADAKAEAKLLADRARTFRRLGYWPETLALTEASLLLDPNQPDLHADAHLALATVLAPAYIAGWLRNDADQSVAFGRFYTRALFHLEQFIAQGGDLAKYTAVGGAGLTNPLQLATRDLMIDGSVPAHLKTEILKSRDERRAVFLRIAAILAKDGERKELAFVWAALRDLPLRERYDLVDKLAAEFEEFPNPKARAVQYASQDGRAPAETPECQALLARWSSSKKAFLQDAAVELKLNQAAARKMTRPLYSTDPAPPNPNAPGPEAVQRKPIALNFDSPPPGRTNRPLVGILALSPELDLAWTADALFLMKEKGILRAIWRSPGVNDWARGGFSSVNFDGKNVWAAYNLQNNAPILLVFEVATGKVHDASRVEGLPTPPESTKPEDFNTGTSPRLLVNSLEEGRACVAGSFFNRAWVGIASFDAKLGKVAVKVIHEARDAQNPAIKDQWTETGVSFIPNMVYPITGPGSDGKTVHRVLVGRIGGTNPAIWDHPLIFDLEKGMAEAMKDRVWAWPGQDCAAVRGSIYFVEATLEPARTRHLVRLGFPGPGKEVIAKGLAPADGIRILFHKDRFHIALDQTRQQPPENGPFTRSNPEMLRQSQWWTVDSYGKNLRQAATRLPIIQHFGVSAHYGLVAIVEPEPGKPPVLHTVEVADPAPKK